MISFVYSKRWARCLQCLSTIFIGGVFVRCAACNIGEDVGCCFFYVIFGGIDVLFGGSLIAVNVNGADVQPALMLPVVIVGGAWYLVSSVV